MEKKTVTVKILGKTREYPMGITYAEIVKEYEGATKYPIVLAHQVLLHLNTGWNTPSVAFDEPEHITEGQKCQILAAPSHPLPSHFPDTWPAVLPRCVFFCSASAHN